MILADTSIWIDFLASRGDHYLQQLLDDERVVIHPFIIGELALGSLSNREELLRNLDLLPSVGVANNEEVMALLHSAKLYGIGIGLVDLHLLAASLLSDGTSFWTRDKRLQSACVKANVPMFAPH